MRGGGEGDEGDLMAERGPLTALRRDCVGSQSLSEAEPPRFHHGT